MIRAGQRLYDERKRRGLSLEAVSGATKIREEFLRAIEKGEYNKLPSPSYAQGFVRSYIRYLELPEKDTLAIFRREFSEDKDYKVLPDGFAKRKAIPVRKFRIRQIALVAVLVIILLIGYISYQYRHVFLNPPLEISAPLEGATLSSSTISIEGKTDPSSTIYIEDEAVIVSENGDFKKEIVGFPGETTINIKAVNRFGKQTSVERHILIK
ncbi:MAG: helix-turn-helix domain-containing protein [Patescibacteria group bacterium]